MLGNLTSALVSTALYPRSSDLAPSGPIGDIRWTSSSITHSTYNSVILTFLDISLPRGSNMALCYTQQEPTFTIGPLKSGCSVLQVNDQKHVWHKVRIKAKLETSSPAWRGVLMKVEGELNTASLKEAMPVICS